MATGSEVSLCVSAYEQLIKDGVRARVVSMPCLELFERQPVDYREVVLPPAVTARVAVEQHRPSVGAGTSGHTERSSMHLRRVGAAQGAAEEFWLHS